jgi:uncharacterized RDD family membrane protein YckC
MGERTELLQIMALNLAMIVASFFPIPYLGIVLATGREPLIMVFLVALVYFGVLTRRARLAPVPIRQADDRLHEFERGR